MIKELAGASKAVLTTSDHIMTFCLLLRVMQQLDKLTDSLEYDTGGSDSDKDKEEEERIYKVAALNVRSLGARSNDKPGFDRKKIVAHNTDIPVITENWF